VETFPTIVLCCWLVAIPTAFLTGQDDSFLLLFIALSATLVRKNLHFAGGLILSLCMSKFHLMIFIPCILIASLRWKLMLGLITGVASLILTSFVVGGWTWPVEWYRAVRRPVVHQNMDKSAIDILSHHLTGPAFAGSVSILLLVLIGVVIYASRLDYPMAMGITLAAGLVAALHVYLYDYLLLLPLLSLVVTVSCSSRLDNKAGNLLTSVLFAAAGVLGGLQLYSYDIALLFPAAALAITRVYSRRNLSTQVQSCP